MTAVPKPQPLTSNPPVPAVVHARAESVRNRATCEWEARHPCGVLYDREATHQPRLSNWNSATLSWLPPLVVNCPDCIAETERRKREWRIKPPEGEARHG